MVGLYLFQFILIFSPLLTISYFILEFIFILLSFLRHIIRLPKFIIYK